MPALLTAAWARSAGCHAGGGAAGVEGGAAGAQPPRPVGSARGPPGTLHTDSGELTLLTPSLAVLQPCPGPAGAGRVAVNYFMVLTWRLPEARRPRCVWPPRRQGAAASSGRRPPRLRGPRHVRRSSLGAARTSHLTHGSLSTFNQQGGDTEARDCLRRSGRSGPLGAFGVLPGSAGAGGRGGAGHWALSGHCPALLGPRWSFTMRGAGCRRPRAGGPSEPGATSPAAWVELVAGGG